MKRKLPLVLVPVSVLLALAFLFQGGAQMSEISAGTPGDATSTAAGMRLYIDPVTKKFVDAPVEPLTPDGFEQLQSLYNTSHLGLVEVDGPVGGGKMVDLKGRFQHGYTAVIDASGNLSAGCGVHESAETTESDSEKESD
jgi:hypothetical protein